MYAHVVDTFLFIMSRRRHLRSEETPIVSIHRLPLRRSTDRPPHNPSPSGRLPCLSAFLSCFPSVRLPNCLSVVHLSTCLFVRPSLVCLSINLFILLPIRLPVCLPASLPACLSVGWACIDSQLLGKSPAFALSRWKCSCRLPPHDHTLKEAPYFVPSSVCFLHRHHSELQKQQQQRNHVCEKSTARRRSSAEDAWNP